MNPDLATYLHDHLAGANAAIEVIGMLQEHADEPVLKNFLSSLLREVREDKLTLEALMLTLAVQPSIVKDFAAWVGARIISLKVRGGKSAFGAFEGIEFLSLGIQGKLHLWKALERSAACCDTRDKPDFGLLIERAEAQHRNVEELRLALATIAL